MVVGGVWGGCPCGFVTVWEHERKKARGPQQKKVWVCRHRVKAFFWSAFISRFGVWTSASTRVTKQSDGYRLQVTSRVIVQISLLFAVSGGAR